MACHTLDSEKVRESLVWRHKAGTLAEETAALQIVLDTATGQGQTQKGRYKAKHVTNIRMVLDLSKEVLGDTPIPQLPELARKQAYIYSMFGEGWSMIANFAVRQPKDFYIDLRTGTPAYPKRDIRREVGELGEMAERLGLDPHGLPNIPSFHNCGIW